MEFRHVKLCELFRPDSASRNHPLRWRQAYSTMNNTIEQGRLQNFFRLGANIMGAPCFPPAKGACMCKRDASEAIGRLHAKEGRLYGGKRFAYEGYRGTSMLKRGALEAKGVCMHVLTTLLRRLHALKKLARIMRTVYISDYAAIVSLLRRLGAGRHYFFS